MTEEMLKDTDNRKYNLYKRSRNLPASGFDWANPEDADGVPILARAKVTASDPNVKTTYNNFAVIQRTKAGYLAGDIIRKFADGFDEKVIAKYTEFANLNHLNSVFMRLMKSCAGWGNSYSLCYLDALKRVRIKQIQSWNACVCYDDNDEPEKGNVYYTCDDETSERYEYDAVNVTVYKKAKGSNKETKGKTTPHGFKGIPLIEWKNNDNGQGNAQIAVSLMDAFDRLMSDNITEWATFRQAYLLLKNMGLIDEDIKEELQKTGVLTASGDNAEARFITKDINPEFVKFITAETWAGIWVVASSVDPKALASLSNATAFQIAQLYRNMEEDCKDTELEWKVSLEYLDRILQSYWTGLDTKAVTKYSTEGITYEFTRNIPRDVMTWLKDIVQAGGRLPQKEIFIKAGYSETEAETLAGEAVEESYASMPDLTDPEMMDNQETDINAGMGDENPDKNALDKVKTK